MKNAIAAVLACCLLLCACGTAPATTEPTIITEAPITEPTVTEPAVTEPTIPETTAPEVLAPEELTMDMFRLAEHNPTGEHCSSCSPFCKEHCYKSGCVLHCQDYMGLTIRVPSGKLYVVGQALSNDKEAIEALKRSSLDNITVQYLENPQEKFTVCGIRYVADTYGSPDPEMEEGSDWDGPYTLEEMSNFGAAVWINLNRHGILYITNGKVTYAVLPFTCAYTFESTC